MGNEERNSGDLDVINSNPTWMENVPTKWIYKWRFADLIAGQIEDIWGDKSQQAMWLITKGYMMKGSYTQPP